MAANSNGYLYIYNYFDVGIVLFFFYNNKLEIPECTTVCYIYFILFVRSVSWIFTMQSRIPGIFQYYYTYNI